MMHPSEGDPHVEERRGDFKVDAACETAKHNELVREQLGQRGRERHEPEAWWREPLKRYVRTGASLWAGRGMSSEDNNRGHEARGLKAKIKSFALITWRIPRLHTHI